jgi:hypothetical protein
MLATALAEVLGIPSPSPKLFWFSLSSHEFKLAEIISLESILTRDTRMFREVEEVGGT